MSAPTLPTLPTTTGQLGPGTLKVGNTATQIDVSCLVNNAGIGVSKNQSASTYKLCGVARAGVTTYQYELVLDIDDDLADASGIMALSWDQAGTTQKFTFTPNNTLGVTFTGEVIIDPLEVKASGYGEDLKASATWAIVGKPTVTRTATPPVNQPVAITGVTAGTPGSLTPANATKPADLAALKAHAVIGETGSAKPTTAWTTGQYILLGDASEANWDGTHWVVGKAS